MELVGQLPGRRRITVGLDKGYDYSHCVQGLRALNATAHVAQRVVSSAIDRRTVRHPGYLVSQRIRKRVEEIFGWMKTVGGYRRTRFRGLQRVEWGFTLAMAAYNLIRMSNLLAQDAGS